MWRATDTRIDRPVAIKRLHARLREDDQYAERFAREATVVSAFDHPGIVKLFDRGEEDGSPYLVFELIEGEDVKSLIQREGRLRPRQAADICAQIADALHYAHQRGVIHRDVKSQNVMLTPGGTAKLTDFGIAYLLDAEGREEITRAGTLVGTSDYLSPEQATGKPVDARTDVYSLGIVLYECLTGELPFRGEGPIALALAHVRQPMPDPRAVGPDVPAYLAACAMRAGAKDARQRFQSAERMADSLRAGPGGTAQIPVLRGEPAADEPWDEQQTGELEAVQRVGERARPATRRSPLPALAVTGALIAAGLGLGILLTGNGDAGGPSSSGPPIEIAAASVRDPAGDGENDRLAPLAIDGDPATAWATEAYLVPNLDRLDKRGVGLVLELATPAVARWLVFDATLSGASFQVIAVAAGSSGAERVVAEGVSTGGIQRVDLAVAPAARSYVLWLTRLPQVPGDAGRFQERISEARLEGEG